jgi:cell division septation protein DedD
VGPSVHPPIPSVQAEFQVKAETKPTKVAVGHADKAAKPLEAIKKTKKPVLKSGSYTLLIGEFPEGKVTEGISTRLKKLGVSPVHVDHVKKLHPMYRLFLANFDDHATADKELQKVRQQAPGVFITKENEKFSVYAGSFLNNKKAVAEQKRLALENIKLIIQTTQVSVSLTRVTAGSFRDGGAATMKARLLQKQGFHVKAIKAE